MSDIPDVREILKRTSVPDSVLEEKELLLVAEFLRACDELSRFLRKAFDKKPYIEELLGILDPQPALFRRIVKTISSEGFIEDTASYNLSKIRSDLFAMRERVRKRLERIMEREAVRPVLQDDYISLRNGRYVIPVKPNFSEVFQGIVHDYSHSLKTSFVEPMEVVELNNAINMLVKDEKEEEKEILLDLTAVVRTAVAVMEENLHVIAELDLYQSLAQFSLEFDCVRPVVTEHSMMEIRSARNPFIALSRKSDTVPIEIRMETGKKVMIISGPNAGGKTAALKTLGLLSLMAQSGLLIPAAEGPVVPKYPGIFAVMGDEQDISMELSSFTAHMNAIKDLYASVRGGELILIDEIGGNTEPQEASALAMGIIDALVEKGCTVVVTTHLNLLKAYGYTKGFAINVATAFDGDTMKPMYRLLYGTAGYSNAIQVARNIRVPEEIIDRSYEYLGKQEYMLNDLISALELGKSKVEQDLEEIKRVKEDLRKRLSLVKEQRDEYLRKIEERGMAKLLELERELEEVRKELAKKERGALMRGREKIRDLKGRFAKNVPMSTEVIRIGDYVKVRSLGSTGHVVSADREGKTFEVVMGNVRTTIEAGLLEKISKPSETKEKSVYVDTEKVTVPEIKVIGLRVEEALREIDRFLDRAVVQDVRQVKIVHGVGTGRLMNAIREHLNTAGYGKNILKDPTNAGVTVIELS